MPPKKNEHVRFYVEKRISREKMWEVLVNIGKMKDEYKTLKKKDLIAKMHEITGSKSFNIKTMKPYSADEESQFTAAGDFPQAEEADDLDEEETEEERLSTLVNAFLRTKKGEIHKLANQERVVAKITKELKEMLSDAEAEKTIKGFAHREGVKDIKDQMAREKAELQRKAADEAPPTPDFPNPPKEADQPKTVAKTKKQTPTKTKKQETPPPPKSPKGAPPAQQPDPIAPVPPKPEHDETEKKAERQYKRINRKDIGEINDDVKVEKSDLNTHVKPTVHLSDIKKQLIKHKDRLKIRPAKIVFHRLGKPIAKEADKTF